MSGFGNYTWKETWTPAEIPDCNMIGNMKNMTKEKIPNQIGLFWKNKNVVSRKGNPYK